MIRTNRAAFIFGLTICLLIPTLILLVFGMFVTIGDGVYAGLILKGLFAPPNETFYTVTNSSNRFLLKPLIWLYAKWANINWFDLTQIVPGILVLFLLLTITLRALKNTLPTTNAFMVSILLTSALGALWVENLVLYDPLSSTLMLPLLVMIVLSISSTRLTKVLLSMVILFALVYAWQIRYHGVFVGFVVSSALLLILTHNPLYFFKQHILSIALIVLSFGVYLVGAMWQDSYLTDEDKKVALMDEYMYTLADAQVINTDNFDISAPADSVKFIAYYSFYFPENIDNSINYLDTITYRSGFGMGTLNNLPIKWRTFWDESHLFTDFNTYHNYDRLMYYMLAFNIMLLLFFILSESSKTWLIRGVLWSIFAWGFFIGIGVTIKMVYKLATPLVFFFIFSFVWFIIEALRKDPSIRLSKIWIGLTVSLTTLIVIGQLNIYQTISKERRDGLKLKAEIINEMNTRFSDKLLIFDLFSMPILENEIGANNDKRQLIPEATMYGDFYMSLFPDNIKHLEKLAGSADIVPFFTYCANNNDKVVFVMSQYRIDLIQAYLQIVKGMNIEIKPIPGDHKIEELVYSFYEVPLQLNYYQIHWTDSLKTDIL